MSNGRSPLGGTPWPMRGVALVGAAFLLLPVVALAARVPWGELFSLVFAPAVLVALRLSLVSASVATALSLVMGVPLAWVLARSRRRGVGVLRALVTLPLVLPPVVGGVALLLAYGRAGLVGRWLDVWWGISLPFTVVAVVVAETFVAMPFLVVTVAGAFAAVDRGLEEAAVTLGASRWRVFWSVSLPSVAPSLVAGTVLCWARALGEFGATVTFAGSLPGITQTMPLAVYLAMQSDPRAAIALSLVLLGVCVTVLVGLRSYWWPGVGR
ncbi:Molybdenum transport system permease protein modB [Dermatophilus congolensis]|uniref:Molybdenum transport system permease n=2 Tax=Dermatophilus congolensis TaxID=1863 RepID=A0AA46BQ08_9MICO|nr:ABC transporter permease [Dermatophilus congolensis]STD14789.1 Molybdenum transport system permease protein modB [Dermatophilus congolensis]